MGLLLRYCRELHTCIRREARKIQHGCDENPTKNLGGGKHEKTELSQYTQLGRQRCFRAGQKEPGTGGKRRKQRRNGAPGTAGKRPTGGADNESYARSDILSKRCWY